MKAVTIGSATIDVITIVDPELIEQMTLVNEHKSFLWLEAGRKIPARSIVSHVGGGACNTAVSLARRGGWEVSALSRTGHDLNGAAVREHLEAEGVGLDRLRDVPEEATGVSSIIASHDRNATIFVHRGANATIAIEDAGEGFAGVDLVHIAPLSNSSAEALPDFARAAKAAGAFVSLNPGIRQLTARGAMVLRALEDVDLLSVNRVEAEALAPALSLDAPSSGPVPRDAPELLKRGLSFGGFHLGLVPFMKAMMARGPRYVVVTDGGQGAYLGCPEGLVWRAPAPAEVAGTAGAGDAFTSTLAAALVEKIPPDAALAQAAVNAASVIAVVDTTEGLLDRATIEARAAGLPPARWFGGL
ncbi:MAG: carbohydrate kinase family protein [Rubrimonas sp.]|uniref:carbohydrate kinase family protein n=1 Tax=Rubrimonas sp. TaxID=2036015 RepID=UPI002FDD6011